MTSKPFNLLLNIWPFGVALYYGTFFLGDPRNLQNADITFNVIAGIIIVFCVCALFWRKNIDLNTFIGAFAIGHSLGASITSIVIAGNLTGQELSSILRLAWVGPAIFTWVYFTNKIIVRETLWPPKI